MLSQCVLLPLVNDIDLFYLIEIWLCQHDYVSLNESTPPSPPNTQIPRDTGSVEAELQPF